MRKSLIETIKSNTFIYNLWAFYKSNRQESLMEMEQREYENRAQKEKVNIIENIEELEKVVQKRLISRGIHVVPKDKGRLHIVYAVAPSTWEKHNICDGLEKFGTLASFFLDEQGFSDYHSPSWIKIRNQVDQKLLHFIQDLHSRKSVDVLFSGLIGWHIAPETIEAINRLGIVTCAYFWDDKQAFRGNYIGGRYTNMVDLAKVYDLNLTNSPSSLVKYLVERGLAVFWPEAANPDHFKPLNLPFEYDDSFIGARYGQRPLFIKYLRGNGINVETFGPEWPNGFVSPEKMVEVYAKSRINLGFGGIGYSMKEMCLKGRDFEVPMCAALYLTSYYKDLELMYEIGKEIITYTNKEDCLRKIKWLIDNPSLCENIRKSARERCLRDHSWEKRFEKVFRTLGYLIVNRHR